MCTGDIYRYSVMNLYKSFFLLFLLIATNSFSQPLITEANKAEIYKGAYEGCVEKQKNDGMNTSFKPEVLPKFCDCFAKRITEDLIGNIDFQIAISKQNKTKIKEISDAEGGRERTMKRFNSCMDALQVEYGGAKNMLKIDAKNPTLNKIGLEGESRRSFIYSGTYSCVDSVRKNSGVSKSKADDYCNCALNNMADKISGNDVLEIMKESEAGMKIVKKIGGSSYQQCVSKLN